MVNRIGNLKLFRSTSPSIGRTLTLTLPGYVWRAPKLKYGWEVFFVGHFGRDKTVYSYKKKASA